ncbi:MAG: hypothetical protein E7468_01215 [Ruminococcaceae bacterium]|nr:hypothetical protein [Oscillospiraceae bacterium]
MDILEFTRRKVAEITGNTGQEETRVQSKYTKEEEQELALDLIRQKRAEQAYASISDNFFTDLQKDLQGLSVPSADNAQKTTGGYYSRPVADTSGVGDIQKRMESLSNVMQQVSYPVEKAEKKAKAAASALETAAAALTSSFEAYKVAPTADAAQAYNQALSTYQKAKSGYDIAYGAYKTAYDQYQKVAGNANTAFTAWKKYVDDSQASYDAWKSTIRDKDTIAQEIDYVDRMIKNAQFDTEMWEWEQKRALLKEEYDWAVYSNMADIKNTPYFGTLSEGDRAMVLDMTELESWTEAERAMFDQWVVNRNNWKNNRDGAPAEVLAWADRVGWDRLQEILVSLRRYNGQKNTEETVRKAQEAAQGVGGGILSTLATVPLGLWNAVKSPFVALNELQFYDERYGNLDPNAAGFQSNIWSGAVRDTVSKNIAGDHYDEKGNQIEDGGWLRQGLATVYGATTSAADNLARLAVGLAATAATGGSAAPITLGLAAMGSFGDTVRQISEQGGDPVQALAMGVISGGLEVLTEKFSVENILKVAKGDPLNFKKTLKEMLKQGAIEVSEEEINFLASTIAEAAIMQEESSYNLQIKELMAQGMSEAEAREQANLALLAEAGETAVQSFLSGGMMTGATSGVNNVRYSNLGQKLGLAGLTTEQAQAIIDYGLESAEDTEAHQMALKLQEKIDAGKVPTKGELAQQIMANEQAIRAEQITGENANVGIKEQLKVSENVLSGMEPVANITTPSNFAEMDLNAKKNWVIEKLRPTGYSVERKGFGIIDFARKKLRAAFNYFKKGSADEAAFEALPYVLEKGVEISSRENHKGRKYSTVTFAAPVTINGQRGNMAVVVRQTQGNQYKVHRVLLPDGSAFYISETENEAESSTTRGVADAGSLASSKDTASMNIIDQGGGIVNTYDQNGGTENANTDGQTGTDGTGAGAGVLHGGGQRNVGTGTGEQTGSLDGGAETAAQRTERLTGASRIKSAVARQNLARSLRLPKVSAQEIGLTKGTERRNLQVLPQEHWDGELQALAQKIQDETGKEPVFVIGDIHVQGADNQSHRIRAAITAEQVILQADYTKVSLDQILDHEIYHYKAAFARKKSHNLDNMNKLSILEQFSKEELQAVLDAYIAALDGQYGLSEAVDQNDKEAYRQILALIREEMMADAYAGINAFGAGADKFTKVVNDRMAELNLGKKTAQENGVRQTNGPNAEQSTPDAYQNTDFAERNAQNAEREARIAEILRSVSTNHAAQFERYTRLTKENPEQAAKEGAELSRGIYRHEFMEYRELTEQRDREKENTAKIGGERYSFHGYAEDGKGIYESNFPKGTPKKAKGEKILHYIQDVWSKKPITLRIESGGEVRYIEAKFDPSYSENENSPTDASKLMGGNRHGNAVEKRVTLDLADDYYQIASESRYNYSKAETGKNTDPHQGVKQWHYFVNDIYFAEYGSEELVPYRVSINVKEKADGNYFYSFSAEQAEGTSTQRTLHAAVNGSNKTAANGSSLAYSIRVPDKNVNQKYLDAVNRGDMQTAQQMVDEAAKAAGYTIKAYHGTTNREEKSSWNAQSGSWDTEYSRITVFKKQYEEQAGHFFNSDMDNAGGYGFDLYAVYLMLKKPLVIDCRGQNYASITFDGKEMDTYEWAAYAKKNRYDGVIFENISDGVGYDDLQRLTTDYVVFDSNRIKSADPVTYDNKGNVIPLSERFSVTNRDIRYSTDDEGVEIIKSDKKYLMDEEEYHRVKGDLESRRAEWERMYLYDQLGPEGEKRYKATQQVENTRKKAGQAQRAKENRIQPGKVELDVESRATEAKRLLENKLLQTFSIPDGVRGELRAYIGGFADRIVKHGALTEDDRRRFFTRMYEAGAVTIPADDYYGEARSYIKGGHIYVPGSVVAEFGDDWQDVRRRAFAAGIYLTYERTDKNGHSVSGIDVWNSDLAADLPGLFDAEDTDEIAILQKIIHVAERGKDEKISLAEYVARVAKEEYTSENDVLDSLERQMTWALKSFAETAKVEIQLKDRNLRRVMKERAENQERAQRAKERRELQELQQKTLKSLQWLNKNRRLAPEDLREEWDRALSDIDLYAVGAANEMNWSNKHQATWKDLAEMYKEARAKDPNFHEDAEIERIISRLDNKKIADMDPAALLDLYKLATGLRTAFYNRNNVLNDEQYRIFEEVYLDSKEELTEAGKGKEGLVDRFLNREQLSAMNVLERMAGWNPNSAWYSMAKQLERGERDVRAFTVKANRILEDYLNEHKDFVMRADGQGKDAIWYTIEVPELMEWGKGNKPIFGDTVTVYMTPAQKVHMYLESKNLDNLRHMEGGRTFVVDKELYGKGKRQEALEQGRTIRLAPETVKQLVSNLTDEEMELAQVLDQYYNGFATGEINRVSNVLYGYDKAMGKHYAPIYTNQNYTNAEFGTFDVTAEGVGNLKGRVQYSKNPSYNISAFDAFERNVNQTARFVGMAIPIRNWTTLMNWTEYKNSMKDTITHAWGLEHKRYIENLLTDLQGGKLDREDVINEAGEKLLSNYISSVFGANMSIVLKQMGSIPLAGAYLGVGNVVPSRLQVERLDRDLIGKYTQDLAWRGMGYSMPETKQLKDHPNWTQNNKVVRFAIGGGAITAMDQWAASVLWPWAENKVRKEHPELEVGTKEQVNNGESPFYKKVAEEFENAVSRSQSTSDQMHQGTLRKSKNTLTRMFTMFTSDSAQTYNTLRQMIGEAGYYKKTGQLEKAGKLSQAAGATVVALLLNALWGEGVNLLAALIKNKGKKYRDEEGKMTVLSILQQMSMGMLSSLSGTVIGGDTLMDMISAKIFDEKFYAPESMEVSLIQDMYNTVDTAMDIIFGTAADMVAVAMDDGRIGEYFKQNGNDLLERIKDAALEIAAYWGIPAANVEAYIVGALKFIPGFGAVYDGWFESADKSALGGLTGENLSIRVGSLLDQRGIDVSDGTADAIAELYEADFTGAVPGGVPDSVTIDGDERMLNIGQRQHYGNVWADIVAKSLDKMISSDRFAEASPKIREGMLKKLYSYASEQAKASMFDDYEPGNTKADIAAYEQAGLDVADYFAVKAEGYNTDKYLKAIINGLPEEESDALMEGIDNLEPMAGEDQVANVQKWRTCVDMYRNPDFQLAALGAYMTSEQFKKAKVANRFDISLSSYVKLFEIRAEYDQDKNGSFSGAEYKRAIDSLRLGTNDSAVLWQLFAGTKSAKNNPYSTSVGQKVLDALTD